MDKLTPCLWFDGVAEEAARFYVSLFPDSRIDGVHRAPADSPSGPKDTVLNVDFTLAGRSYIALNGGPEFTFNEAISLSIDCKDQADALEWAARIPTAKVGIVEVHPVMDYERARTGAPAETARA